MTLIRSLSNHTHPGAYDIDDIPVLALQQFYGGPQVSQLVPEFLQCRGGQRWMPELGGGGQTRGGRRGGGAMAGGRRGQDRGLDRQRCFTVRYLKGNTNTNQWISEFIDQYIFLIYLRFILLVLQRQVQLESQMKEIQMTVAICCFQGQEWFRLHFQTLIEVLRKVVTAITPHIEENCVI